MSKPESLKRRDRRLLTAFEEEEAEWQAERESCPVPFNVVLAIAGWLLLAFYLRP